MDIYNPANIGKQLVRFDVNTGISPAIEAIVSAQMAPKDVAYLLEEALKKTVDDFFPQYKLTMEQVFSVSVMHSRTIKPKEEEDKEKAENLAALGDHLNQVFKETTDAYADNPDNDKEGYWRVTGIRHSAVVFGSSAPEVVQKAINSEAVGEWENPDAEFIGHSMPEIFEC